MALEAQKHGALWEGARMHEQLARQEQQAVALQEVQQQEAARQLERATPQE